MDSPNSKSQTENPNKSSVTLRTPPRNMLTRSTNRSAALSVKEIHQAARSRRRCEEDPVDKVSSAKRRLVFSDNEASSSASKRICINKTAEKEKLPDKYEILGNLFDSLDSLIRLSILRGSELTFSNISGKIEYLTDRRFCYSHLAQIKHILPEAIEINRVLVHDETTSCMKPDLHVTLNADAVSDSDKSKSESKNISLRTVFRTRLADFVKSHPQGDEVPQEQLPEPFNTRKPNQTPNVGVESVNSLMEEMSSIPAVQVISSFMKVPSTPSKTTSGDAKQTLSDINLAPTPVKAVSTPASVPTTPAKIGSTPVTVASTPPEFASTPARHYITSFSYAEKKQRLYKYR